MKTELSDIVRYGLPRWLYWSRTHLPIQEIYEMRLLSLDQEDPLDEGMAILSSILAWRILWTE